MKEHITNHETLERCPFCEILKRTDDEMILKRGLKTSLILSLEGHPLLVTNSHSSLSEIDPEMAAELGQEMVSNLNMIKRFYKADGVNVHTSLGESAGQEIEHTHIHIIPRFVGDVVGKFPKGLPRKPLSERQTIASGLKEFLVER